MAILSGIAIGALAGLIGLGGAEFRLPLLISVFAFVALEAEIVNKTIGLVVVASALAFRQRVIPPDVLLAHWPVAVNLLAGSLLGAWLGADFATRLRAATLYRVIAVLLLGIAGVLAFGHLGRCSSCRQRRCGCMRASRGRSSEFPSATSGLARNGRRDVQNASDWQAAALRHVVGRCLLLARRGLV